MIMSSLAKDINQTIDLAKAFIQSSDPSSSRCSRNEQISTFVLGMMLSLLLDWQSATFPYSNRAKYKQYNSTEVNDRNTINQLKIPKTFSPLNSLSLNSTLFKTKSPQLLEIHDMPKYLQFNPYIQTGYRKMLSTKGSVKSLFYFHNETINILSHGIPIVYILWTVPSLIPWEKISSKFLPICHIVGSVSPWVGSFLYHLFMNHAQGGERLYRKLLQLDMIGIWVTQSFGALPMVCSTSFCFPWSLKWLIILSYCLMSAWGLRKAVRAWSPWDRRMCFALPFATRLALTLLRATGFGGGDPGAIKSVFLQDFLSLVGGIIGAVNIPERWFPGHFDFCFNSHNIMHILVVLAVYFMHQATIADLKWMATVECGHSPKDVR